eukprot:CAMPEP_0115866808 /NCGR_PEP_ID=MMETSP0287-20121206/20443_1 /TAXON_ID=412157 /ORGANISM="Chrysochromulina rotalis, Strain UIO044" /LENGTH=91 /DNA_ID=CAMNT_0003321393 /DNA_START=218 /DNA_END=493 /DNA_ORIENTATION=-
MSMIPTETNTRKKIATPKTDSSMRRLAARCCARASSSVGNDKGLAIDGGAPGISSSAFMCTQNRFDSQPKTRSLAPESSKLGENAAAATAS